MNALAFEFKDNGESADSGSADSVVAALNEFKTSVDSRLENIETANTKLADRMDEVEAKLNRPGARSDGDSDAQ